MTPDTVTLAPQLGGAAFAFVVLLALAAIAGSFALHWIRQPQLPALGWLLVAARFGATFLAWWLTIVALSNLGGSTLQAGRLIFATTWPLALWSFVGALGTEVIIALYKFERQSVSRLMGGTLLGLRVGLLLIALFWLTQPRWHKEWEEKSQRYVAVFVDLSASMGLTDTAAPARERLDLARLFGIEVKDRPADFSATDKKLKEVQEKFGTQLQLMELISPTDSSGARLAEARFAKLKEASASARESLAATSKTLEQAGGPKLKLEGAATTLVTGMQGQIKALLEGPLTRLDAAVAAGGAAQLAGIAAAREDVAQTRDGLNALRQGLTRLPYELDEAFWRGMPPDQQKKIQDQTNVARAAIARQILTRKDPQAENKSIAEKLDDNYVLKFYHFASRSGPVPTETYIAAKPAGGNEPAQAGSGAKSLPVLQGTAAEAPHALDDETPAAVAWRSATDIASAIKLALEEIPQDRLSGAVILSDGRHNANSSVDVIARQLKERSAAAVTVLIGSRHVPKDVAVSEFELPPTIMVGDKLAIKARLKLDGYGGSDVLVRLMRGNDEVKRETIRVPEQQHRHPVEFSDTGKAVGTYPYRIEILAPNGGPLAEAEMANNTAEKAVSVTDDRIKVLLVENQARWDFRYLKNQFSGTDTHVQLQYVLTNATRLADAPAAPPVHVSASRPLEQREGTLLPENEKEWMKFDVIILGDLSPSLLTKPTLEILDKFVYQRGGTIVVLAGPDYMPHAYADTKLAEMLPMRCDKLESSLLQGPEPGFQVRLSDEGRQHVVMKQISGSDTEEFWRTLPEFRWRHPKTRAKEGAVRLAYAKPSGPQSQSSSKLDPKRQERMERNNCIVALQEYGAGKVMMFTTDESWRLRYRIGPAYHDRLWSQVVRWGANEKLQAGTAQVRLGTDQPRYDAGQKVTIKARLSNEKSDPISGAEVDANIFSGDKLLRTVRLTPKQDMPGRYENQLELDAGLYRIELAGPAVAGLLAKGDVKKVDTEIAVSASKSTSELVELTADDTDPKKLGKVVAPLEAASIFDLLGQKSRSLTSTKDWILWDTLPVMLLFLAIGSVEWILRKKAGLT